MVLNREGQPGRENMAQKGESACAMASYVKTQGNL